MPKPYAHAVRVGHIEPHTDDDETVTLALLDEPPAPRRSFRHSASPAAERPLHVGTMVVRFDRSERTKPRRVVEVSLQLVDDVTPSTLRRFPWSRTLAAADAFLQTRTINSPEAWRRFSDTASLRETEMGESRRRGRPSLGPAHYAEVAQRYTALSEQGERAPVAVIAEESGYNRNTVAGWVRRAREMGFLAPPRRGRAG